MTAVSRRMTHLWAGLAIVLAAAACSGGGKVAAPQAAPAPSPTAAALPAPTAPVAPPPSAPETLPTAPGPTTAPTEMASPTPEPTPAAIPLAKMRLERAFSALSFRKMVALAYPDDGTQRLFLALQPGQIAVFANEEKAASASLFLDIQDQVNDAGNEEGLLGLAFDPNYRSNGYFYVDYTASNPRRSVISRFAVSRRDPNAADPKSEQVILEVLQPYPNHNGGQLVFGPDGYLYIGLGDGGSGGDPHGHGQDTSTLLGSILRIDVTSSGGGATYAVPSANPFVGQGGGARPEIWAYGLRNPWRFSFDRATGDLWAGDVGQDRFEEVDIIRRGGNYGWNIMEGAHCFKPLQGCPRDGLEMPVIEYSLDGNCSVIGGYVYRGARLPSLYGAYLYGDFCSGKIWALRHDGLNVTEHMEIVDSGLPISSFGEDPSGELYVLSFDGHIYRLQPL